MSSHPTCRLSEILLEAPITGIRQGKSDSREGTLFIATACVSGGAPILNEPPQEYTSKAPRGRLVQLGDLLLISRAVDRVRPIGCAKVAFEAPATFSDSLIRLRINQDLADPDYVRLFLTSRQGRLATEAVATGTVITNLPKKAVENLKLPLPELSAQRRLADTMAGIESMLVQLTKLSTSIERLHDVAREGLISEVLVTR